MPFSDPAGPGLALPVHRYVPYRPSSDGEYQTTVLPQRQSPHQPGPSQLEWQSITYSVRQSTSWRAAAGSSLSRWLQRLGAATPGMQQPASDPQQQPHMQAGSADLTGSVQLNISEGVPAGSGSHSQGRADAMPLLNGVSGAAAAGRLLALMGPSGAGKSTLLNLLAGDAGTLAAGTMGGQVLLDGKPRDLAQYRKTSCFVRQVDVLLPTATVREALQFQAALQLPHHWTKQQRAAAVDAVLTQLGLHSCADTLIGDETSGSKGVSGGERRRLTIAQELLRSPQVVLLDEPTTGLDSATALQVISCISTVAKETSAIVVLSVHQPGPELCAVFDDLLLLAPHGRCCYMGPWDAAVPWFRSVLGAGPQLGQGEAEWLLSLMSSSGLAAWQQGSHTRRDSEDSSRSADSGSRTASDTARQQDTAAVAGSVDSHSDFIKLLVSKWSSHQHSKALKDSGSHKQLQQIPAHGSTLPPPVLVVEPADTDSEDDVPAQRAPHSSTAAAAAAGSYASLPPHQHLQQHPASNGAYTVAPYQPPPVTPSAWSILVREVSVLSVRSLRWWGRDPSMLLSELLQYVFAALFLGSVYPQLVADMPSGVADRLSALFGFLVTLLVTAPSRGVIAWDMERRLLRWELDAGTYRLTSFLVSKLLISVPLEAAQALLVGGVFYLIVGLQRTAVKFWSAMAIMVLTAINASTTGHVVGVLVPNLDYAFPLLCVVCTFLLSFCGFMVQRPPVYWGWVGPASFSSYAYAGLVRNEFEGLGFKAASAAATPLTSSSTMGSESEAASQFAMLYPRTAAAEGNSSSLLATAAQQLLQSSSSSSNSTSGLGAAALLQCLLSGNATSSNTGSPNPATLLQLLPYLQASTTSSSFQAAVSNTLVDGMTLVPHSIFVDRLTVGGSLGVLLGFTVVGWVVALLLTVVAVKLGSRVRS